MSAPRSFALWFKLLLGLAGGSLMFPQDAHAYIDPGSGSFIIQIIIAALLGALFALKMYWRRTRAYLAGLFSKRPPDDEKTDSSGREKRC
jgi:Zn-dependent protease with chaperone function